MGLKFDVFSFMENRKYNTPLSHADSTKFDPYMTSMILSMYPNANNTGPKYGAYLKSLNHLAFHRLDKNIQAKAYESFNGESLHRTQWLKKKATETDEYQNALKISKLLDLPHKTTLNAIKNKTIKVDECLDLYYRVYEPASFLDRKPKTKAKPRNKK
jgi:hypothetical protein